MSFGKMNTCIEIVATVSTTDVDGFVTTVDTVLASVRAYFEPKNSTEKWANMATFSTANALFRFRKIPGIEIESTLYIASESGRYRVVSAEDVRGRGMYIECLCEKVEGSVM